MKRNYRADCGCVIPIERDGPILYCQKHRGAGPGVWLVLLGIGIWAVMIYVALSGGGS